MRYLVLARKAGIWSNIIDPGERTCYRGFHKSPTFGSPDTVNASVRYNDTTLEQLEYLKTTGKWSGSADNATELKTGAQEWLAMQASGTGIVRAGPGSPWVQSSTEPDLTVLEGASFYDTTSMKAVQPGWSLRKHGILDAYPPWASETWANVEGFVMDYLGEAYFERTSTQWSTGFVSYGSQKRNCLRANTRDPRFVLLPGGTLKGAMTGSYKGEWEIHFVSVANVPLDCEFILLGGPDTSYRLTWNQIGAWQRARPPYPKGDAPPGESLDLLLRRNPGARNPPPPDATAGGPLPNGRGDICTLVFSQERFRNPKAVRRWARENEIDVGDIEPLRGHFRLRLNPAGSFRKGSFRKIPIDEGVTALVGTR